MSSDKAEESSESGKRKKRKPTGFEEWGGYMESKKMKLNAQFEEQVTVQPNDDTESKLFSRIAIFVNGYTKPPADQLKKLMLVHGGKYHHYYSTTKTTHVIASNLPHSKMKNLKTQTVVTADWITDSIKAGKLLSHHEYLLYTPEQVDKQQRLPFKTHCLKSETETLPEKVQSPFDTGGSPNSNLQPNTTCNPQRSNVEVQLNTSTSPSKSSAALTARHPDFLSEFYNNSRLHHISTAGQELKRYVQHLAERNKERHFPDREKLRNLPLDDLQLIEPVESFYGEPYKVAKSQNVIMHLDMDCFFVSVGLKKHPELRGLPVAVTHAKGKKGGPQEGSDIHYEVAHYANESKKKIGGVVSDQESSILEKPKISIHSKEYGSLSEIASCSYEARKAGLRNGMFLGEALRRCPNLRTIPYDFEGYSEVSKQLYSIVARYTLDIEAVSCDELYIDCKELLHDTLVPPSRFASILRAEIEQETGCTASAGMGSNMLIARLANKVAKPNGQHYVHNCEIENFMKIHKVGDLPGVGYSTSKKLVQMGVISCCDLQAWSLEKLQKEFGPKTGQSLFNRCRGKDSRTVQLQKDRKSVSAEINYGIRFETDADVYKFITDLSSEVTNRLQNIGSKGKSLTLKLMVRKSDAPIETAKFMGHGVCDHLSKSISFKTATDSSIVIANECCAMARSLKIKPQDFRGVGIQMSKLELHKKEVKFPKMMESFICNNKKELQSKSPVKVNTEKNSTHGSPRLVNKSSPIKNTIKDFLSNNDVSEVRQEKTSDYLYNMPSPSFLEALPEDIRHEVIKSCPPAKEILNPIPSCSKQILLAPLNLEVEETNQNYISSSFLDALPEDLKGEVLKSHQYIPEVSKPDPSCLKDSLLSHSDTNKDKENTLKYIRESIVMDLPEAKRKEVLESYSVSLETEKLGASNQLPQSATLVYTEEPNSNKGSYVIIVTEANEMKKVWSDNPEVEYPCAVQLSKNKTANLGGAFEIDEIRSLLREWVQSTEEPLEDDVDDLNNFFMEAVEEKSFYKVEMILKYLHRLAKSATCNWKEIYLATLSKVKKKMESLHDYKLHVHDDFL